MVTRENQKVTVQRLNRSELEQRLRELQERRDRDLGRGDAPIDAVVSRESLEDDIADLRWLLASAR